MKKLVVLLLVFALCLTACGESVPMVAHTHEDLTISIPENYIDLSEDEFAQSLGFVYGLDPIAVNGLREPKETFTAYGLELDAQRYGEFVIMANKVSAKVKETDGILNFSYESGGYTYVVTVWETEEAFWTVQAYCPTENYNKVKNDMWEILSSVTV